MVVSCAWMVDTAQDVIENTTRRNPEIKSGIISTPKTRTHRWLCSMLKTYHVYKHMGQSFQQNNKKIEHKKKLAQKTSCGCFRKYWSPKSSILIGFSIINHPFWGTPIFGNTHVDINFPKNSASPFFPRCCENPIRFRNQHLQAPAGEPVVLKVQFEGWIFIDEK